MNKNSKAVKNSLSNKDWTIHFDNAIRYTRWLLRFLGIWHLVIRRPIKMEKHLSKAILPFVSTTMLSLTVPIGCHIILREIDRIELMALLGPLFSISANTLIHLIIIMRSDILKICVQHMELDWQRIENSYELGIMTRHLRYSHTLTLFVMAFMYTGALSYLLLIPIMSGNTINGMNETLRPRPFPGTDIFFDVQADVVYETVFAVNFLGAIFHCTITTAVCNLAAVMVSHACGQIQIIVSNFEHFVVEIIKNNQPTEVIMKRIGMTVRNHVRLLGFAANIEEALTEIFFIEVVSTTLVMCFIEYDIVITVDRNLANRVEMITWIILLISFSFNLLLYCKFGEVLKERCEAIGKLAYMTDWYRLPPKTQLALVMIIKTGDYPCTLTAGRIMELSIANYASITKTSLAYLNMFRTTMG